MNAGREQQTSFQRLLEYEQRSMTQHVIGNVGQERTTDSSFVVFRLGEHQLALPIDSVTEILELPQWSAVPGAKPWLLGLANIRGNLVTVCDLLWFLSGVRSPLSMRSRLVVTSVQKHPVGLIVDEVLGRRHYNAADSSKTTAYEKTDLNQYVERVFDEKGEAWGVFKLEHLCASEQFLNGAGQG
jgi:twitching motility protein PilI